VRRSHASPGLASPADAARRGSVAIGFGRIVAELLERLDLHEVTLVQNDHAAALVLRVVDEHVIGLAMGRRSSAMIPHTGIPRVSRISQWDAIVV
jgi:hypothetical protein